MRSRGPSGAPPDGYNRGHYASPVMDHLVRRGRALTDPAARRRAYGRVQARAATDLPVLPLWWEDRIVIHHRALHGFEARPSGDLRALSAAWLAP